MDESGNTSPEPSLGPDRIALEQAVLLEQIRVLYQTHAIMFVNLVNALLTAYLLRELVAVRLLVVWIGLFCVVVLARFLDCRRHLRAPQQAETAAAWGWRYAAGATATGCLWGLTAAGILISQNPTFHAFIAFVVGGMMAGAVAGDSAFLPALIGFSAPAALPVIFAFFARGDPMSITMGFMVAAFATVLGFVGFRANHWIASIARREIIHARDLTEIADASRIVENSSTILYRLDPKIPYPITYVSRNIDRYGYSQSQLLSVPGGYMELLHPDDRPGVLANITDIVHAKKTESRRDVRIRVPTGTYVWIENRMHPVRDSDRNLIALEGIFLDITDRKRTQAETARLTYTDLVTGLPNRMAFMEWLQQAFAATKEGSKPFAILYLDLDDFKDINETLGHSLGDELLKTVAQRLGGALREEDRIARVGGDEFAALLTDVAAPSAVATLAARIIGSITVPHLIRGSQMRVTASIGISDYRGELTKPEDMMREADLALYEAKDSGRNKYVFHSEALDIAVRERVTMVEELRAALDRGEFEVYYQPQVEVPSQQIVGVEAVLRWNHPSRGLLTPGHFIAIARKPG